MRLLKDQYLNLSAAVFAGLWMLEARTHQRVTEALERVRTELEQQNSGLRDTNERLRELDRIKRVFADCAGGG